MRDGAGRRGPAGPAPAPAGPAPVPPAPGPAGPAPAPAGPAPVPASLEQERAWLEDRLAGGQEAVTGAVVRVRGPLDVPALAAAVRGLAARHPSLRTSFALAGDTLTQVVAPPAEVILDTTAVPAGQAPQAAAAVLREPFDLGAGPLLRARLIQAGADDHLLVLAAHRAAADEPSLTAMLSELGSLYAVPAGIGPPGDAAAVPAGAGSSGDAAAVPAGAGRSGDAAAVPAGAGSSGDAAAVPAGAGRSGDPAGAGRSGDAAAVPGPAQSVAGYARAQRQRLAGGGFDAELGYWREQLDGAEAAGFPAARPGHDAKRNDRGRVSRRTAPGTLASLRAFAAGRDVPAAAALIAACHALMARYTTESDVTTGVVVNARRPPGVAGQFTDVAVLRATLSGDPSFGDLAGRAAAALAAARRDGGVAFGAVLADLRPARDPDRYPFFEVGLDIAAGCGDPAAVPAAPGLPGLACELAEVVSAGLTAGLCLGARVAPDGELALTAAYPAHRYDKEWVTGLLGYWETALSAGLADPGLRVSALPLLSERGRREALAAARGTPRRYPAQPVHTLVAQQAARTPGAVAVSCAGRELSYAELTGAADTLAGHLRSLGAGPGSLVGLFLGRDIELLVAILGVLGAGAGFLPLDTSHPPDRLAMICEDAGTEIVLTDERLRPRLPAGVRPVTGWPAAPGAGPGDGPGAGRPPSDAGPDALCHVVFTSGSTGRPKGVAASHRNVTAFVSGLLRTVGAGRFRRTLFSTALSFDACLVELWPPLVTGGTLVIVDGLLDAAADPRLLDGITLANAVPSVLAEFLRTSAFPASLRTLMVGAEPLPGALVRQVFERSAADEVYNMYGPTEATSYATMRRMPRSTQEPLVTIGRPIDNVTALVLDRYGNPAPAGMPGELFLGGPGVAIGYRNAPGLTGERFVTVAVGGTGQRMYRTGDACRRRADGELEFLGRMDDQVKVRGFRIELGEVEAALARHPAVRAAVAAVREDPAGRRRLVGYFVTDSVPPATAELVAACRRTLPASLVPEFFVQVPAIPRTATGKASRRALPDPRWEPPAAAPEPSAGSAGEVADLWRALLRVPSVSWQDNFFDLGGSSLLATVMADRLGQRLGVALPPALAWSAPTVAALAREIDKTAPAVPAAPPREEGQFTAPRTGTERDIAAIFADVLEVPRAGALDDFFDLGGSSLNAAVAIARIRHQLGVAVPMADFIVDATVAAVAQAVEDTLLSQVSAADLAAAYGAGPDPTDTTEAPDHG
jgi:amino acid adenylation domain-containing protein